MPAITVSDLQTTAHRPSSIPSHFRSTPHTATVWSLIGFYFAFGWSLLARLLFETWTDRWCTTATSFMYRSFSALPPQKQSSSNLIMWVGRRMGIRSAPFFKHDIIEVWNKIPSTHVLSRSPVGGWLQSFVGLTWISLSIDDSALSPLLGVGVANLVQNDWFETRRDAICIP